MGHPSDCQELERSRCTTAATLFSWKRRMAAMPGGSGIEAGVGVGERDPTEGQDWDVRLAGLLQRKRALRAVRLSFRRPERRRRRLRCSCGFGYFCWRVTGDCDQGNWW